MVYRRAMLLVWRLAALLLLKASYSTTVVLASTKDDEANCLDENSVVLITAERLDSWGRKSPWHCTARLNQKHWCWWTVWIKALGSRMILVISLFSSSNDSASFISCRQSRTRTFTALSFVLQSLNTFAKILLCLTERNNRPWLFRPNNRFL